RRPVAETVWHRDGRFGRNSRCAHDGAGRMRKSLPSLALIGVLAPVGVGGYRIRRQRACLKLPMRRPPNPKTTTDGSTAVPFWTKSTGFFRSSCLSLNLQWATAPITTIQLYEN